MYVVGVDLGQSQDYTAVCVVESGPSGVPAVATRPQRAYQLRYLSRLPLGTPYPEIVRQVLALLERAPLTRAVPLVVDKTGVGAPVVDMFRVGVKPYAGVRPRAVTITGGESVQREDPFDLRVPKRHLASLLVALYQSRRLQMAPSLPLVRDLIEELKNFKVKVNLATGHDSYEAWRESIHDDLVLTVALACWYAEQVPVAGQSVAGGTLPHVEAARAETARLGAKAGSGTEVVVRRPAAEARTRGYLVG